MRIWICLFPFLLIFPLLLNSKADHVAECDALLQFSNSFTISQDASEDYCDYHLTLHSYYYFPTSYPKTASWKNSTDCCSWDGVTCYPARNHVIGLDLSCSWLLGPLHSNSTLFSLPNLRHLNLAGNDFNASRISPKFGIFTGMAHLNLSASGFSGPVPLEMISHLSDLITLDLSCYNLGELTIEDDSFKLLLQNLTHLRELSLDHVNMSKVPPISLMNLSSTLTFLSLSFCNLRGIFPIDIFHLPNLQSLSLHHNSDLTVSLPQANLTSPLVSLDLSHAKFHGSIPASVGILTSMKSLDLSVSGFAVPIPQTIGNLNKLTHLDLGGNNLSATINFELFERLKNLQYLSLGGNNLTLLLQSDWNSSFPKLQDLDLYDCKLTKFPYFLRTSAELRELRLGDNMIDGEVPGWFWSIVRDTLTVLDLSLNNFTGDILSSMCQLSSLHELDLASNRFNGTIPICLGNLSSLSYLYLSQNLLQGTLPRSLANCTNLKDLQVSNNGIYDTFPGWLTNAINSLSYLDLHSNMFRGVVEVSLPPQLSYLILSNNKFSGELPINFLLNSIVVFVDMANNNLDSPLPIPPSTIRYYSLSDNMFREAIPHQICNATGLRIINLSNNSLTDVIPSCFINISASLTVLDLGANMVTGQIPEIFIPNSELLTICLSQNQLAGTLPQSLAYCQNLEVLDLSENELEGRFPHWLDSLPNLQVLSLRSNKFHGPVDSLITNGRPFPNLRIFDLSKNSFLGPLPAKYLANLIAMKNGEKGGLHYMDLEVFGSFYYRDSIVVEMKGAEIELVRIFTMFTTIDLSSNFFEGEIPKVIGDLKALKGLNFSHNNLSGNIPASVRNLTNLEWLDLSSNKLNGMIPGGLAAIPWLSVLNLSNNQLTGPIPQSTQFDTFSHSFDGNPGLCGRPLPKSRVNDMGETPPSTSHEEEETKSGNWIEWRAVPMGYGCGLVLGISIGYIVLETRRPRWLVRMIEQKRSRKARRPNKNISPRNHGRRSTGGH